MQFYRKQEKIHFDLINFYKYLKKILKVFRTIINKKKIILQLKKF